MDKQNNFTISCKKEFIYNYTDVVLQDPVQRMIGVGPKFSLPVDARDINMGNIIKEFEFCVREHPYTENKLDQLRMKGVNIITNFYSNLQPLTKTNTIKQDEQFTRNLLIARADKGNSIVVIYKDEYIKYMT
ncbi:hypothetical protein ACFFRR_008585 [Megaselia abdita]